MHEGVEELPGEVGTCALCDAPIVTCLLLGTCPAGLLAAEGAELARQADEGLRVAEEAAAQVERLERENLNMRRALRRTMTTLLGLALPPALRPPVARAAESIRDELRNLGEEV